MTAPSGLLGGILILAILGDAGMVNSTISGGTPSLWMAVVASATAAFAVATVVWRKLHDYAPTATAVAASITIGMAAMLMVSSPSS